MTADFPSPFVRQLNSNSSIRQSHSVVYTAQAEDNEAQCQRGQTVSLSCTHPQLLNTRSPSLSTSTRRNSQRFLHDAIEVEQRLGAIAGEGTAMHCRQRSRLERGEALQQRTGVWCVGHVI